MTMRALPETRGRHSMLAVDERGRYAVIPLRRPGDHRARAVYPMGDPIPSHVVCERCGATQHPGEGWVKGPSVRDSTVPMPECPGATTEQTEAGDQYTVAGYAGREPLRATLERRMLAPKPARVEQRGLEGLPLLDAGCRAVTGDLFRGD